MKLPAELSAEKSEVIRTLATKGFTTGQTADLIQKADVATRQTTQSAEAFQNATRHLEQAQALLVRASGDLVAQEKEFVAYSKKYSSAVKDYSCQLTTAIKAIDRAVDATLIRNVQTLDSLVSCLVTLDVMRTSGALDELSTIFARMKKIGGQP